MLLVYGALMPLRLLEELRFWKGQEKEHSVVVRELIPQLEHGYERQMKQWEAVFLQSEAEAQQWIEAVIRSGASVNPSMRTQIQRLIQTSASESKAFIQLLHYMLNDSDAVKQVNSAPIVILHMIRESEYFLGVMQVQLTAPTGMLPQQQQRQPHTQTLPQPQSQSQSQMQPQLRPDPQPHAQSKLHSLAPAYHPASSDPSTEPNPFTRPHAASNPFTNTGEGLWSGGSLPQVRNVPIGGHALPPLPYNYHALEPYIDEKTMRLHHDLHHKVHVDGLNQAELSMAEARQTGDYALIRHWEREAAINGAGHYLHTLFWNGMRPQGSILRKEGLGSRIEQDFGSYAGFKQHFSVAAEKVEGCGWAVLVWSPRSGRLEILQAENNQNGAQWDAIPLLVLDVWEHAYYLKYPFNRSDYIQAWWNIVNWPYVNERFHAASTLKWQPY